MCCKCCCEIKRENFSPTACFHEVSWIDLPLFTSITSILATLISVLPSSLMLFRKTTTKSLLYNLTNGALGFFLFSFQVHEKSILLPLLPATLLLLEEPVMSVWFNNVAMFSMFPLLRRDGLVLSFFSLPLLWNYISLAYNPIRIQYSGLQKCSFVVIKLLLIKFEMNNWNI